MANFLDTVFEFPQSGYTGENSIRYPWNNTIFPGNYVAHLNAYRDQNVQAFPGVNFFRVVGAYVVPQGETTVAAGDYELKILSPDLREDDKPRLDRDLIIRGAAGGGGARVYRVGISTVNLAGNSSTIKTKPADLDGGAITLTSAAESVAGAADGVFPEGGEFTDFAFATADALTADTIVGATVGAADLVKINPSKEAAILVEVCFIMNAPAADSDDVHLPFPTESGQSSQ